MRRVAVIGSGIAGLSAARTLASRCRVEIFEAAPYAGGHTNTVAVDGLAVDTGFIVYNERTYPRFTRLLAELDVATRPTDMSFSAACDRCGLEWGSAGVRALFAQRANLVSPRHYRMLREVLRFFQIANRSLVRDGARLEQESLDEFLARAGISTDAVRHFVIPMGAAIWSTAPAAMREFPAATYLRFFANHGMLAVTGGPRWRTIVGGSRVYVERLLARLPGAIHLSTPVARIHRDDGGVTLDLGARQARFDAVVIATHSDTALSLLADPSDDERRVLGAIRYTQSETVLHTDDRLLPAARDARSCWNVRVHDCRQPAGALHATYWMNRLQGLESSRDYLVTLNPSTPIDPRAVIRRISYAHPLYDLAAIRAQRELDRLQGGRGTWFCGAYQYYGFHEDGLRSGEEAAHRLIASGGRAREAAA